jgi:spermidine/putrescine transport system substrate-binding protein
MQRILAGTILVAALLATASAARAEGALNLYNWANYTNPDLINKFEETHDIKVAITDFGSNAEALAKVQAGEHEFDLVVLSAGYVKIFADTRLLLRSRPDRMENFKNVAAEWRDPVWDPGRHYSVPWQWGSVGMVVDTEIYSGDIDTSAVVFDPPPELEGKINVAPEMGDIMGLALLYVGSQPCTDDKEALKKARDVLVAAKPKWLSMDYGITEKMPRGDFAASAYWNGAAFRARLAKPSIQFGYPKEGYPLWMDSVAILKDAKNVENAKLFLNFVMDPENAALISAFARYAHGITGSEAFMPADMNDAREIAIPAEFIDKGVFLPACSAEVNDMYTAIWTELTK